jgi:hypothetical protein
MQTLLALTKVKPGEERALSEVLAAVGTDPAENDVIRLPDVPSAHFARWNIVTDPDNGPRLLFFSFYDGSLDAHLNELVAAGPGVDQLWGHCEGYPGRDGLAGYLRAASLTTRGVYIGFPDDTVAQVQQHIATRQAISAHLDRPEVQRELADADADALIDHLVAWRGGRQVSRLRSFRSIATVRGQAIYRKAFIPFAKWFASIGQAKTFPLVQAAPVVRATDGDGLAPAVSNGAGVHHGLTVLLPVAPRRRLRLQVALVLSNALTKHGYDPGVFADMDTIHGFVWAVVDDGKRFVFASFYDGSWQRYVLDFVDKVQWGLDAIFGNADGYPSAGMKDVLAFSSFMGAHAFPPRALYSAYPDERVANLMRDRAITEGLAGRLDRASFARWLARL